MAHPHPATNRPIITCSQAETEATWIKIPIEKMKQKKDMDLRRPTQFDTYEPIRAPWSQLCRCWMEGCAHR
jgi:hypothetical protein